MKPAILFILLSLLFTGSLAAETVDISSTIRLHFDVPAGWVSDPDPPQFLLEEMAEHIEHDAAAKGRHPSKEQLLQAARNRFNDNEALLHNPQTHSFLSLDFSPLRQGERPPSRKSIKLSTRYASESLGNEEGVAGLTTESSDIDILGARYAHRFDSRYTHHDKPMAFTGVVGFVSPYWFFLYYTDYLNDERDRGNLDEILKSIRIENRQK